MVEVLPLKVEGGALPYTPPLQSSTYCASHEFWVMIGGAMQYQPALKTQI